MSKELLLKLLEYIDAKVAEYDARGSSDGGLIESIAVSRISGELTALVESGDPQ